MLDSKYNPCLLSENQLFPIAISKKVTCRFMQQRKGRKLRENIFKKKSKQDDIDLLLITPVQG